MAAGSPVLLIFGHVWPEPQVSAAGRRMMQLIQSFKEADYTITFASPSAPGNNTSKLEQRGVRCLNIPLNEKAASDVIREIQPNVVIFDRFMTEEKYGWRVEEEAPLALRILNTEDLHSLRIAREIALNKEVNCELPYWLNQDITLRELASILRCDLSLIISKNECRWLEDTAVIPKNLYLYLPFMLKDINNYKTDRYTNINTRSGFLFAGYGKHRPNADAVRWLVREIWPQIRRDIPDATLDVYGQDYPADVQALHQPGTGIFIRGWLSDLDTAFASCKVNLAPLRFGAGLKGKIVHGFQQGAPGMMTRIAAEGLFPDTGFEPIIADEAGEYAKKAVALYRNNKLWQKAVASGTTHLANELDYGSHHQRLHDHINRLIDELAAHREKAVMSRILRHHSLQSTRYFAKWIEAKNQK